MRNKTFFQISVAVLKRHVDIAIQILSRGQLKRNPGTDFPGGVNKNES